MADFEAFMQKVTKRPMPQGLFNRVHTLAKELAEGVDQELWYRTIFMEIVPASIYHSEKPEDWSDEDFYEGFVEIPENSNIKLYLEKRWQRQQPHFSLLETYSYLESKKIVVNNYETPDRSTEYWQLTKSAFQLVKQDRISTVFISYRRIESSALALLLYKLLAVNETAVFVDKDLKAGESWHAKLEENIKQAEFFIALIGKRTLTSKIVLKEITWAIQSKLTIIPIWHNGFKYKSGAFKVSSEIDHLLTNTHTIRVLEESALAYNNAIVELLNRFGITP